MNSVGKNMSWRGFGGRGQNMCLAGKMSAIFTILYFYTTTMENTTPMTLRKGEGFVHWLYSSMLAELFKYKKKQAKKLQWVVWKYGYIFYTFNVKRLIINITKNVEICEIMYIMYIFERDKCIMFVSSYGEVRKIVGKWPKIFFFFPGQWDNRDWDC